MKLNYKIQVTVTSNSLSELVEYINATPGATLESVSKEESTNGNGTLELHSPYDKHQAIRGLFNGADPRLVMKDHPDHPSQPSKAIIDVEASLKNIGLTQEQLMSRPTRQGSVEHSIKRAVGTQGKSRNKGNL